MLVPQLRQYAESLDETNYRVRLKEEKDYFANRIFYDGEYWTAQWFEDYWRRVFEGKLRASGVKIEAGARVLDICCGHGYLGQFVQDRLHAQVTFCDLSLPQLRGMVTRLGPGQKEISSRVCSADLLDLPFHAGSFEIVTGNSFLHHLPDVPAALAELARVQATNGVTLLLHEPNTTVAFWRSFPCSLFRPVRPLLNGKKLGETSFSDLWLFRPADLCHLCLQAGYRDVRIMGVGMLSTVLLNWYLLLALRLNWRSRRGVYPAYLARAWLDRLEGQFQSPAKVRMSPSLTVVARG